MQTIAKIEALISGEALITPGDTVVVGISGGPDSVCLLHVLASLRQKWQLNLAGVHINHQLRGEAADQDQAYAEQLCRSLGIPCQVYHFDVRKLAREQGLSTEDAGRRVRYEAFFQTAEALQVGRNTAGTQVKIAVAQNQDDQAETVLMRILRGTGLTGLAGIAYKRDDGVIRPLLTTTRAEIEAYCRFHDLRPRIDQTNLEPVYTRNRVRLELLPYLREHFNPNVSEALTRLADIAREEDDYLEGQAHALLSEPEQTPMLAAVGAGGEAETVFSLTKYQAQHPALRKRLLALLLKKSGAGQNVAALHFNQADALLMKSGSPKTLELPGGWRLAVRGDHFHIFRSLPPAEKNSQHDFGILRETVIERDLFDLSPHFAADNPQVQCFDLEAVRERGQPVVLRGRQAGDFIRPLGMSGRKKLQDYFVDRKIPKEARAQIPLVALGSEILWVVGGQINENFKVKEDTRTILLLEYTLDI